MRSYDKQNKIERHNKAIALIFALIALFFSLILLPYYTGGDQEHYRLFYNDISNYSFLEGFIAYRGYLGASEPVYYLIVYIFNGLLDKDILIAIINTVFSYYLVRCLLKLNVNLLVVFSILFNFYFIVLLFSAERLKFSMMFFFISLVAESASKKYTFILLSVLSHLQSLMLIYVQKVSQIKKSLIKYLSGGKFFKFLLLMCGLAAFVIILYVMRNYLIDKYAAYSNNAGIANVIKPIIFCGFSILYYKKKWLDVIAMFLPLILASILVGEERIVIFCYGIFFYFAVQVNRGFNLGIMLTTIYFSYKGIEFVQNIINHGTGFYTP